MQNLINPNQELIQSEKHPINPRVQSLSKHISSSDKVIIVQSVCVAASKAVKDLPSGLAVSDSISNGIGKYCEKHFQAHLGFPW